jgi:hypothetical protein
VDDSPDELAAAIAAQGEEQMQTQAAQITRHLHERRREVDQRESHLNARIAQLENDLRNARLWLQERHNDFAAREAELSQRIAEQEARMHGLSATELAMDDARLQNSRELQNREESLRQREEALAAGQGRLAELERIVLSRQERLNEQERSLDEQWRQFHEERAAFHQEITQTSDEVQLERRTLAEQRQQVDEFGSQQKSLWETRNQHFDERQIALDRIRQDILRLHREALEMRLVAEQLWSHMSGKVPAVDMTQGIARLRAQLADEFRFAQQEITTQRGGLESLLTKLDSQRQALAAQKDELVGWFTRRQQEIARQTAELENREQQLRQELLESSRLEKQWQAERAELQRQIRKLTLRLRDATLVAA